MIRWTFYFQGDGTVKTDCLTDKEDGRIAKFVRRHSARFWGDKPLLSLPGKTTNIYINMDLVKCVTREELAEDAPPPVAETPLPAAMEASRAA